MSAILLSSHVFVLFDSLKLEAKTELQEFGKQSDLDDLALSIFTLA